MDRILQLLDRKTFLFFLLPFAVYMVNFREISNGDPTPTVFVALSVLKDGDLYLDELHDYIQYNKMPYYLSEQRGHVMSNYPVVPGLLAAPVFVPAVMLDMIRPEYGDPSWRFFSKTAGSVFTALSVLVLYLTLRRLIPISGAAVCSFAYAFGTASWSISSQSLWQHGPSCFLWSLLLYSLVRANEKPERHSAKWLVLAGLVSGLAVCCRLINLAAMPLVLLAVFLRWRIRGTVSYLACFLPVLILLFSYNFYYFGTWNGGLAEVLQLRWFLDRVEGGVWETPLIVGVMGNLISPSRGLLIFSPFLIFSLWGMVRVWREPDPSFLIYRILMWAPIVLLLIFGKYTVWWGGNSHYGPRYQIEMLPVLILMMGLGWTQFAKRPALRALFGVFLVYAVFVQWIGAFCYPSDWAVEPVSLAADKGRLWDWSYNQIVTCLRSGINPRVF